mmetsp:Transcript_27712/g.69436  ORF Transcript_27712/g.69436 Transcript_27712/m.69436 type:complete len:271 (-) Transcript_27712:653-1465(-)
MRLVLFTSILIRCRAVSFFSVLLFFRFSRSSVSLMSRYCCGYSRSCEHTARSRSDSRSRSGAPVRSSALGPDAFFFTFPLSPTPSAVPSSRSRLMYLLVRCVACSASRRRRCWSLILLCFSASYVSASLRAVIPFLLYSFNVSSRSRKCRSFSRPLMNASWSSHVHSLRNFFSCPYSARYCLGILRSFFSSYSLLSIANFRFLYRSSNLRLYISRIFSFSSRSDSGSSSVNSISDMSVSASFSHSVSNSLRLGMYPAPPSAWMGALTIGF